MVRSVQPADKEADGALGLFQFCTLGFKGQGWEQGEEIAQPEQRGPDRNHKQRSLV